MNEQLSPKGRRWRVGAWIPLETLDDCDRLIEAWRATGEDEALVAAWRSVEPWAIGAAQDAWWKARWRVGTTIEPEDLVSLAKLLFLERLAKRWDTRRGSFLIYAMVSFRIEFYKWNKREVFRKSSEEAEKGAETLAEKENWRGEEARIEVEMAFQRIERQDPALGERTRWCYEHLHVPLRELARISAGRPGYSRSALSLKMKAARAELKRRLGGAEGGGD